MKTKKMICIVIVSLLLLAGLSLSAAGINSNLYEVASDIESSTSGLTGKDIKIRVWGDEATIWIKKLSTTRDHFEAEILIELKYLGGVGFKHEQSGTFTNSYTVDGIHPAQDFITPIIGKVHVIVTGLGEDSDLYKELTAIAIVYRYDVFGFGFTL